MRHTSIVRRKRSQGHHGGTTLAQVGRKADRAHIAVGLSIPLATLRALLSLDYRIGNL